MFPIRQPRSHGRRIAFQGLVRPTEIVPDSVESRSVAVVLNFLEKALVSRVNLLTDMRVVRLCRSTIDVLIEAGSGRPTIGILVAPMHSAGLYRRCASGPETGP